MRILGWFARKIAGTLTSSIIEDYLKSRGSQLCYCNKCDHINVKDCEKNACTCCLYDDLKDNP